MGQEANQNTGLVPLNAELVIRNAGGQKFVIEGRWIDTKNIAYMEILADPKKLTLYELFAAVENIREMGHEE